MREGRFAGAKPATIVDEEDNQATCPPSMWIDFVGLVIRYSEYERLMNDIDDRMQDAGDDLKTHTGLGDVAVTTATVGRGPFSNG